MHINPDTPTHAGAAETSPAQTPLLIGLCAWSHAGKNTVASYLEERHDFYTTAFAEPLYAMLMETGAVHPDWLINHRKDQPIDALGGKTPRELLQSLGDWYLATFGERALIAIVADVWRDLQKPEAQPMPGLVASDCRTLEEASFIQQSGGVIWWVDRPGYGARNTHRTEAMEQLKSKLHRPGIDCHLSNHGTQHLLASQIEDALIATRIAVQAAQ